MSEILGVRINDNDALNYLGQKFNSAMGGSGLASNDIEIVNLVTPADNPYTLYTTIRINAKRNIGTAGNLPRAFQAQTFGYGFGSGSGWMLLEGGAYTEVSVNVSSLVLFCDENLVPEIPKGTHIMLFKKKATRAD